jgi:hypothetical protein
MPMLLAKSNFYLDSCLILFFARARERPKWKWQYGDSKDRWYKYNQMWPSISNISRERDPLGKRDRPRGSRARAATVPRATAGDIGFITRLEIRKRDDKKRKKNQQFKRKKKGKNKI